MDDSIRYACERTIMAQERTLMAWIRTATSLITFGFTIYKFFALELGAKAGPRVHQVIGPREFALFMILIGLFALAVATFQNVQDSKSMRKDYPKARPSLSSLVAAMIAALGLLAMAAVLLRW